LRAACSVGIVSGKEMLDGAAADSVLGGEFGPTFAGLEAVAERGGLVVGEAVVDAPDSRYSPIAIHAY
jgi:hypothetical protein